MTDPQTVEFLLKCLIGVVAGFGVGVCVLLWNLFQKLSDMAKDHGERLAVLETRAGGVYPAVGR